jgi:hypothetical protein
VRARDALPGNPLLRFDLVLLFLLFFVPSLPMTIGDFSQINMTIRGWEDDEKGVDDGDASDQVLLQISVTFDLAFYFCSF